MYNIKRIMLVVVTVTIMSLTASAGNFRWGVKGGISVNNLHFNEEIKNDLLNAENQLGFSGGVMLEYMLPITNLSIDGSVMYVHRNTLENSKGEQLKRDFVEIPVHVKYSLYVPVVGKAVIPYVFLGPSVAFKLGETDIEEFVRNRKCEVGFNVGLGVELFSHFQISGNYGMGLTKALDYFGSEVKLNGVESKESYWTITAAIVF
jgi:hypothetical protein